MSPHPFQLALVVHTSPEAHQLKAQRQTRARDQSKKMGKIFQVKVIGFRSEIVMIDVSNTQEQMDKMTVLHLKEKIAERLPQNTGKAISPSCIYFVCLNFEVKPAIQNEYDVEMKMKVTQCGLDFAVCCGKNVTIHCNAFDHAASFLRLCSQETMG